jgi:tetratricopeptide (TPR) repeat protein
MRISWLAGFVLTAAATQLWGQAKTSPAAAPMSTGTLTTGGSSNGQATVGGFPRDTRILLLQGTVVLDDGTLPRDQVTIERVCGTYVYKEGYTNQRGEYSIQLGANAGVFMDASQNGDTLNPGNANQGLTSDVSPNAMWDCELRAALTGYHSESISLSQQRNLDSHTINIILHHMGDVRGSSSSATSAQAPKDAQKAYEKGLAAVKASKPDDAQKELLKAVDLYPRYVVAWFELGKLYELRQHAPEAKDAYNKAVAVDGNFTAPYEKLYQLAYKAKNWQETADLSAKLLALNPYDYGDAYYYNSLANLQLGKLEAAEKSGREAVKVKGPKADIRSHYTLGVVLAQKGDFPGEVAELRAFLLGAPNSPDRARIEEMIKAGEQATAQASAAAK